MKQRRRGRGEMTVAAALALVVAVVIAAPTAAQAFCRQDLVCAYVKGKKICSFKRRCDYNYRTVPRCTVSRRCYQRYYCTTRWRWRSCGYRTYCKPYRSCF